MKSLFTLLAILVFTGASAQKYELGKVSIEELKQKSHPSDTSAVAAILFKKGKSYFTLDSEGYFILTTEVETRIKIYKKEGYSHANTQITYYADGGGRDVKVFFDDAYTYNLVNDKIEKTKLQSDGEFQQTITETFRSKKIAMPNVKEGSVIEYKSIVKTPHYHLFPDWNFEYTIPADYLEYKVSIASPFAYNRILRGHVDVEQTKPETAMNPSGDFAETRVSYKAKNVKAYKDETYVNNIRNYISILEHELSETHFPNSPKKKYSSDWESVAKTIYEHEDFGDELKKTGYFEEDLNALLKNATNNEEKMNLIFNYVQSSMNWNEKSSYYCDNGVKQAYKEKVGNVAEINLMLTAMLRYAEINANPVLLSTRSNGIASFPNWNAFNYVVVAVESPSGLILLDATSKYTVPGILPVRALNWIGRIIRNDKSTKEVDLMPKINSKETINVLAELDAEGKFTGKIRDQYFDYNAYAFRERYLGITNKSYIERLERQYKGIQIENFETTNEKELAKPVVENYSFVHDGLSEIIGDKIYFSPMLFFTKKTNPFKQEKREYPIDFIYPHQDKYMINIAIPKGYVVESLPKSVKLAMEQNIGAFSFNISSAENKIQVVATFDINYANVSPEYYETLKSFYKAFIEKQNEKIVLKKV